MLAAPGATRLRAAVSYVQLSGAALLFDDIAAFVDAGHSFEITADVGQGITTFEGLEAVLAAGAIVRVYNAASHSFHPKAWLAYDVVGPYQAAVGSGNLTRGGLVRNVEIAQVVTAIGPSGRTYLLGLDAILDRLEAGAEAIADVGELEVAEATFRIPSERKGRKRGTDVPRPKGAHTPGVGGTQPTPPYGPRARKFIEDIVKQAIEDTELPSPTEVAGVETERVIVVANPLRRPNTPGELRLSIESLRLAPAFWNWPDGFATIVRTGDTYYERHARVRFQSASAPDVVETAVRIYVYPRRGEFRITSSQLRSRGDAGDIIEIGQGQSEDFVIRVTRIGEASFAPLLALCVYAMPFGRRWGFA